VLLFAIKNGMQWEGLSGLFPVMPQYSLERVVRSALEFKNEPHKNLETAYREGYAHEIASSVLDLLIHVGVEAAEKKSSMVMAYAADTIRRTALLLMAENSKYGFDDEVRKAVGGLAGIYQHADDCPLLDHVPHSLMEIALNSIDATRDNITLSVIGAIQQMTVKTMSWDKHGYDTQRLAGRLIVAGSYAANAQNKVVADACLKGLTQYDTAYARKYGKPKELLQLSEAQELHDEGGLPLEEWQDKYRKMPRDALDQFIASYKNAKPVKR